MINLTQQIEMAINKDSINAIDLDALCGAFISRDNTIVEPATLKDFFSIYTIDKNDYEEGVLYVIPDKHFNEYNYYRSLGKIVEMTKFALAHGVPCGKEASIMFSSAILLSAQGFNNMAQSLMDQVHAAELRKKYYPVAFESIKEKAYRKKMSENAAKPRNKHYEEAIRILKRTWDKYPGASKKSLFKAVKNHLNGGVSEDSLRAWAKAEGMSPDPFIKKTSFTLVVD